MRVRFAFDEQVLSHAPHAFVPQLYEQPEYTACVSEDEGRVAASQLASLTVEPSLRRQVTDRVRTAPDEHVELHPLQPPVTQLYEQLP
ncbi:hypothetical protein [Erythrobacter aureus]|uniref:Uncharacterized protein n=1 Tax=Erythrobacter aureus TaxID=2182384 RepID=A0A345YJ01_9SPHN|nr:hypothetical protein [Erythrobacter aureus]AXK43903.1 hypothetical protein DVR09_15730 [Erythrobacter aureus]